MDLWIERLKGVAVGAVIGGAIMFVSMWLSGCAIHRGTTKNIIVTPEAYDAGSMPFLTEGERLDAGMSFEEASVIHEMQYRACLSRALTHETTMADCVDMLIRWDDELAKQLDAPVVNLQRVTDATEKGQ